MPFDHDFQDLYLYGIKETCESLGIVAERVDEQHLSESILERVYRQIENSDFVIAEMTGRNPNVFYEVGYAHAKSKLCALITQDAGDIPFDLKHHPHVVYDGTIKGLKNLLVPRLEWMKSEAERLRSETISVTVKESAAALEKDDWYHKGSFDLSVNMRNVSGRRSPEIEAIYVKVSKDWAASTKNGTCPFELVDSGRIKRNLVTPNIKRLSPGAFSQESATFTRTFWSKFSGQEARDIYIAKGTVGVDVVTSEGTLTHNFPLELKFEEFPF